jgi:uncharacterized protein YndB with AHSA1/START domain
MSEMLHEIEIEASPEKVFEALTTEAGFKGWWTVDSEAKPAVGSLSTFGFFKRAVVFKMRVVELTPAKTVRWHCEGDWEEWIGTKLRFDLEPWNNSGTRVRFNHAGWLSTRGDFARCNTSWGALMVLLKSYSEGKQPGPFFKE